MSATDEQTAIATSPHDEHTTDEEVKVTRQEEEEGTTAPQDEEGEAEQQPAPQPTTHAPHQHDDDDDEGKEDEDEDEDEDEEVKKEEAKEEAKKDEEEEEEEEEKEKEKAEEEEVKKEEAKEDKKEKEEEEEIKEEQEQEETKDEEEKEKEQEEGEEGKGEEGMRYAYEMPQWQWSHHWQRRERKLFLDLCSRALDRCHDDHDDGTLRPRAEDVKRLKRAWKFIVDNLDQHAMTEEELFFPALRKAIQDDEGQALIDHLLSDHQTLESKLHGMMAKLDAMDGEGRTKEALQAFTDEVSELLAEYGEHINEEEEKVVPFVRRFMSPQAQKEVGTIIKNHHKKLPTGKYGLIMFRDVLAEHPEEHAAYNATFPFILRKIIIPIMAATDGLYKEYKTLFYEPWP